MKLPNSSLYAILGASDPEMAAIRLLLQQANIPVFSATKQGRPVHSGNAYEAEWTSAYPQDGTAIYVECCIPDAPPHKSILIDHHRPGDPGYGKPPEAYMSASSVGQVIQFLFNTVGPLPWPVSQTEEPKYCGFWHHNGQVLLSHGGQVYQVPQELVYTAAADHCLAAAYAGHCPSIDPTELAEWRIQTRSHFQGVSPENLKKQVENAKAILRQYQENGLADLRHLSSVPELPEAAAQLGIAFLARLNERNGGVKVVLQAAPPELVERFLKGKLVPGLTRVYGDAARGFAGGYLT